MKITLKQLEVFLAIYRHGSTVAAAKQVFLSQSAVSMALAELEKHLDTVLFHRVGKRLVFTQQAHRLSELASAILTQAEEIETVFKLKSERLVIGASTTIGNYLLPKMISVFQRKYEHFDIRLDIFNSEEICQGLVNYDYNLGFIEGDNQYSDLKATKWWEDELVLFAADNSKFFKKNKAKYSFEELKGLPLILRETGSGTRTFVQKHLLQYLEASNVIELGNSEAIKQAVVNDLGVGCLSYFALQDLLELRKIKIIDIEHKLPLKRPLYMLQNKKVLHSEATKRFIEFAFDYRYHC